MKSFPKLQTRASVACLWACVPLAFTLGVLIPSGGCAQSESAGIAARSHEAAESAPEPPSAIPLVPTASDRSATSTDIAPTSAQKPSLPPNVAQHTFSTVGRDFDPDVASDGVAMAFASTAHSENPDIFIKAVDGFAVTQITSDPADDIQPRFSPDGERLAFCSNRGGNWDIWIVGRDGTSLTQLTRERTDEIAPCWAPDGKQIAFSAWNTRANQWEIWTVSVDQPGTRRFLCAGMFPAWSPDGGRIAFQRARQRGTRWFGIWAIDLVGGEARHPTELATDDRAACIAPRWAPNGRTLAFGMVPLQGAAESNSTLWTVDAHSGVRKVLTAPGMTAFNPAWGEDGRVFFVSHDGKIENIWSIPGSDESMFANAPNKTGQSRVALNEGAEAE